MILKGGTNAEKSKSPNNFLDSCSLLPILKWQVIAPLQLCKKEQEGTCDFEGGLHREKNNRVPYIRGNGVKNNRVQELNKTCYYEGGLHQGKKNSFFGTLESWKKSIIHCIPYLKFQDFVTTFYLFKIYICIELLDHKNLSVSDFFL